MHERLSNDTPFIFHDVLHYHLAGQRAGWKCGGKPRGVNPVVPRLGNPIMTAQSSELTHSSLVFWGTYGQLA